MPLTLRGCIAGHSLSEPHSAFIAVLANLQIHGLRVGVASKPGRHTRIGCTVDVERASTIVLKQSLLKTKISSVFDDECVKDILGVSAPFEHLTRDAPFTVERCANRWCAGFAVMGCLSTEQHVRPEARYKRFELANGICYTLLQAASIARLALGVCCKATLRCTRFRHRAGMVFSTCLDRAAKLGTLMPPQSLHYVDANMTHPGLSFRSPQLTFNANY